jgi:hypothetical protein
MERSRFVAFGVLAFLVLPGALPPAEDRAHPELETRLAAVRTLGIVEPAVEVIELDGGGGVVRPDWADAGRAQVRASLERELRLHGFEVSAVSPATPEAREELRQVKLLYDAVGSAIVQAIANRFPWKLARFEYTVGDVGSIAGAAGADALVFTDLIANVPPHGRGWLERPGTAGDGGDWLVVGMIDRGGDVLWFRWVHSTASDVRDPSQAAALVRAATDRLPPRPR